MRRSATIVVCEACGVTAKKDGVRHGSERDLTVLWQHIEREHPRIARELTDAQGRVDAEELLGHFKCRMAATGETVDQYLARVRRAA